MHYTTDILDDYLHGELDADRDAAVHLHLDACDACRAHYDASARVRDWLRSTAVADEREFPSTIKAAVWETLRAAPPRRWDALRAGWRAWLAVPVAAALGLVAFFGLPAIHGSAPSGIAAGELMREHAAGMADNPLADHGLVAPASTAADGNAPLLIEAVDSAGSSGSSADGN